MVFPDNENYSSKEKNMCEVIVVTSGNGVW